MKERPILFKGEMVNAIIDGRKTQTRRIIDWERLHKQAGLPFPTKCKLAWFKLLNNWGLDAGDDVLREVNCPYGKTGDRLWVRETWRVGAWSGPMHSRSWHHWVAVDYSADNSARKEWLECPKEMWQRLRDQSESDAKKAGIHVDSDGACTWAIGESPCRWRPSIHMPRWASRILLEITDVRVERLQDISEEDAQREGFAKLSKDYGRTWKWGIPDMDGMPGNDNHGWQWVDWKVMARNAFWQLWNRINGTGAWDANPWVWVIEFKRVEPNQ